MSAEISPNNPINIPNIKANNQNPIAVPAIKNTLIIGTEAQDDKILVELRDYCKAKLQDYPTAQIRLTMS